MNKGQNGNHGFPLRPGATPPLSIIYKEESLVGELDTIPVEDMASKIMLKTLGKELIFEEGLEPVDTGLEVENDTLIIPIDED